MRKPRKGITVLVCLVALLIATSSLVHLSPPWLTRWAVRQYDGHERLWAHRVNSLERLRAAAGIFNGVELDIVFDGGVFHVTHPPDPPTGLTLDTYLGVASGLNPTPGLWLDLKNLTENNRKAVLGRLMELSAKHSLDKANLIIESQNYHLLPYLSQGGFDVSYYLSYQSPEDLARNIEIAGTSIISFEGDMYEHVTGKVIPLTGKRDLLTWRSDLRAANPIDAINIRKILKNLDIRVLLIRFKTD